MGYEVKTDVFQGPFDLLLAVLLREEISIAEVELGEIVVTYVEHLERSEEDRRAASGREIGGVYADGGDTWGAVRGSGRGGGQCRVGFSKFAINPRTSF